MAKQKLVLNPPAELEKRPSDITLPAERFLAFSLFAQLKAKPSLEKFPGTLALRHFRAGEVICQQGVAGWTAFYALTTEDVLQLRREQLATANDRDRAALEDEMRLLTKRQAEAAAGEPTHPLRAIATIHLATARPDRSSGGLLARLARRLLGQAAPAAGTGPLHIPIDGPTDIPYDTRQATMYEGELFGEMSCQYGRPRSATVVAARDCYLLEMLRNILDSVESDRAYQPRLDAVYKQRVLQNHLRGLELFRDLSDEQFERIRDRVELLRLRDGQLICDEHDRSDSMYLIRSGLVKVMKNVSALLGVEDVLSWPLLASRLGGAEPAGPCRHLGALLPEPVRATLQRGAGSAPLSEGDQRVVVDALNDLIKDPQLTDARELADLKKDAAFVSQAPALPAKVEERPAQDVRRCNRLLLELACPGALRSRRQQAGPEYILAYRSRGESLGEMGLITGHRRSATCVAYVHPRPEGGQGGGGDKWRRESERVEVVRIPEAVCREMIDSSPVLRRNLERIVADYQKGDVQRLSAPVWDDSQQGPLSARFEELGLIQGQKLMLIDLDRCTRCDECVRACVNTHTDGRTRLFLDGPRYGKYLVPTTCRACLDPVCMIGCPVGSIHRGDNKQIVIENWCIGCGLCARNCPYGAIQMHDVGLIPEEAYGWRYQRAASPGDDRWTGRRHAGGGWLSGQAPFHDTPAFRATLSPPREGAGVLCFRREFHVSDEVIRAGSPLKLEVTSADDNATVWINGQEVRTEEKPKRGKREYLIAPGQAALRQGDNVLAVRVTPAGREGDLLLEARLDEVRLPAVPVSGGAEVSEKLVTELAVVCDMCSAQFGQRPACVTACPHDAAMRVDARTEAPMG